MVVIVNKLSRVLEKVFRSVGSVVSLSGQEAEGNEV